MPRRRRALLALATLAAGSVIVMAALPAVAGAAGRSHRSHARLTPITSPATSSVRSAAAITEQVSVAVQGDGMSVSPSSAVVKLTRDASTDAFRGTLPEITVTDARGSLAGWTLSVTPTPPSGGPASIDVHPAVPIAVTGVQSEVIAGAVAHDSPAAVLASAPAGGGGGTFTVPAAAIVVRTASDAPSLVMNVRFALS
jgi:hypothetical protein